MSNLAANHATIVNEQVKRIHASIHDGTLDKATIDDALNKLAALTQTQPVPGSLGGNSVVQNRAVPHPRAGEPADTDFDNTRTGPNDGRLGNPGGPNDGRAINPDGRLGNPNTPNDGRPNDGRTVNPDGQAVRNDGRLGNPNTPNDGRPNDGRPNDGRPNDGRTVNR